MEFSSREKDELLKKIAVSGSEFRTEDDTEKEIAKVLFEDGVIMLLKSQVYVCGITNKGKILIDRGGYEKIEKQSRSIEIEQLTIDNLKHAKKTRWADTIIKYKQAIVIVATAILFVILLSIILLK